MRLPAPKCVPLNGFPKLNAYVWSATLFIQNDSAASARGPRAIVQVVTKSTTCRLRWPARFPLNENSFSL